MKIAARYSSLVISLLMIASVGLSSPAQAPVPFSSAIKARAQAIVDKMTLDEKLAYVGGTGFWSGIPPPRCH